MAEAHFAEEVPAAQDNPLHYLLTFCRWHGLKVTSGEHENSAGVAFHPCNGHSPNSLHYRGRAVDVSVSPLSDTGVEHVITQALKLGINVYDERTRPRTGPWTGPHLHLSISPPGTREL